MRRLPPVVILAMCAAIVLGPSRAGAHPLGNFTINHLDRITAAGGRVTVTHVVDMAEIPTFSLLRGITSGGDASPVRALVEWSRTEGARTASDLVLTADGAAVPLHFDDGHVQLRPGAGGLPTLYWTAHYDGSVSRGRAHVLAFEDRTYPGRLGWKDVVLGDAPEPTDALRHYPSALIGSPRDRTAVSIALDARGGSHETASAKPATNDAAAQPSAARSGTLSDMLARGTGNLWIVLLTMLAAVALGALHALEPGHGKTLLAVSLVGARATAAQAAILAGGLTFAHTIGVLLLGIVVLFASRWIVPDAIYPWVTLVSGVAVAFVGARALARVVATLRPRAHAHVHHHLGAHEHDHVHAHGLDGDEAHARHHAIPGTAPLTFPGVVVAAMSGAVAPCPAAIVVLIAAVNLHQIPYGLTVIVAFSLGLAGVLTGLGMGVVRGAAWLARRPAFDRFTRYAPFISAGVIATIGAVMVGDGMAAQQGLPAIGVAALVLCAIAGYALTALGHGHAHAGEHSHAESHA